MMLYLLKMLWWLLEHHHHLHLLLYIPVKHQRKKLRIWTLHVREQPLLTQFLHHYTAKKFVQDSVNTTIEQSLYYREQCSWIKSIGFVLTQVFSTVIRHKKWNLSSDFCQKDTTHLQVYDTTKIPFFWCFGVCKLWENHRKSGEFVYRLWIFSSQMHHYQHCLKQVPVDFKV